MRVVRAAAVLAVLSMLVACGGSNKKTASSTDALTGVFKIDAAKCDTSTASGSWFRMVQPGGNVTSGPFVANPDSTCGDNTVTPLAAGTDGGLKAGSYQDAVIQPQGFFAVPFDVSTNEKDPQTGVSVKPPTITRTGNALTGDLSAISVSWNQQHFNQGAPKPGAGGNGPTGTYDEATHRYTLDWTSRIEGGPFNGFTGMWHLEGTFQPA